MTDAPTPASGWILLVEDDDDIRETMEGILRDEGYQVTSEVDGEAALAFLQRAVELPTVIFLDLTMPRLSGREFVTAQRSDPRLAGISVVVMSAVSGFDMEVASLGVAGGLRKPVDLTDLLDVAERYVPRTR